MKKFTLTNVFTRLLAIATIAFTFNACISELYPGGEDPANPSRTDAKTILNFELKKSANPALAADVSSKMTNMEIVLTVPFGTNVTALKPSITFFAQSVSPASEQPQNFTTPVTYTATAQDGSTAIYTVKVLIAPALGKDVTSFKLLAADNAGIGGSDVTATITGTNIAFTVPYGTDVTALKPSITHTGASTNPANQVATNFSGPVTYTITAGDGSTKAYTVTATVAANPAKDITSFILKASVNSGIGGMDVTGTITGTNIAFTVPFGTNVTALKPTIALTGNSVNPANEAATDFSSPVTYTVTAADGSTKTYTVTATVSASPNKDITNLHFKASLNPSIGATDLTATITGTNITIELPNGSNVTALKPTITHTGASISTASEVARDFTTAKTYTVTAQDGSTKVYTVTVTVALAATKEINSMEVKNSLNLQMDWTDVTGVITGTSIAIELPSGTDVTALKPTFVHTGDAVSTASEVARDFTTPQTYTVTAQDGTTKEYTVTVTVRTPDVYIAGYESNGNKTVAKYWKNGVATSLTDGSQNANGNAIQVVGTDVYVAGTESNGSFTVAKTWKNGVATSLTDGTRTAYLQAIFVNDNGDVFVAGPESNGSVNVAKYWKNGVPVTLGAGATTSNPQSITVDGTNVYVGGNEGGIGKIWKNGVATTYSSTTDIGNIIIDGTDVYAAATVNTKAGYLKNGVATTLGAGTGKCYSMLLSNGDIHAVGSDGTNILKYWKNGVATNVTTGANVVSTSRVSIRLVGIDVYIVFQERIGTIDAIKLWKNGVITNITDGNKNAYPFTHNTLFIVRK